MALTERDTLRRVQIVLEIFTPILAWLRRRPSDRIPTVKTLDDRLLRDIGLYPADIAADRHRLPSQHDHHPRW